MYFAAGKVSLPMPSVQIEDMDAAINDTEVISELERVMAEWCAALTDVIQGEADKHPTGSGPLAGWACLPHAVHMLMPAVTVAWLYYSLSPGMTSLHAS